MRRPTLAGHVPSVLRAPSCLGTLVEVSPAQIQVATLWSGALLTEQADSRGWLADPGRHARSVSRRPKAGIYNGTRLWTGPRALSAGLGLAGALPLAPGHKTQVTVTVPMNCCGGGNLQAMQAHEAYLGARRWRSGRLGVAATCCEPGVAMVPRPAALPAARWSSVSVVSSCCRPSVPEVLHLKGAL